MFAFTQSFSQPMSFRLLPQRCFFRLVRPSVLDLRFKGDPWIVDRQDGTFSLCLGGYCLAGIVGMELDLPSMNQALERLRRRTA